MNPSTQTHRQVRSNPSRSSGTKPFISLVAACLILAAGVIAAGAQALTWDPSLSTGASPGGAGTWDLNTTANWYNGTADVQWTDNSVAGTNAAIFSGCTAGTVTLNTSLSASNLQFTTTGYTLSGSGTLTLGAGGIDASGLSSGTTTIGNALSLSGGQQPWRIGSGGTLAINGTVTRSAGATVDFSSSGVTSTSLAVDASGILGGWATVNGVSGSGGDWVTNNSGTLAAYTGYTAVTGNQTGAGASAQNWQNSGGAATLTANATINSLNQLNDFTVNAGVTCTLGSGGLLMAGNTSRWFLEGSATTSFLTSGASSGELDVYVPGGTDNNWTIWPIIKDNGATPLVLVKNSSGLLKLGNMNTYTGGTIVNAGTLCSTAGAEYGQGNAPLGIITPFGYGTITVNNAQLQLGSNPGNAAGEYDYTNAINLNKGTIYERDGFHHSMGNLTIGAGGGTLGSTYDNKGDALNKGFAKGLFVDGLLTGTGNLTVQDSGIEIVNGWDSSTVYLTSMGTAAQNTYSGNVTVNSWSSQGGSYLYLIGTNVLANATINVNGNNSAGSGRFGSPALLFGSGTNLDGVGYVTIGGLSGNGSFPLANTKVVQSGSSLGAGLALTVGNNNSNSAYSGVMSGAGSLTKIGSGTLTLSGANTYTGNTTINAGSLALSGSGSIANSTNISVVSGATLDVSAISFTLGASQNLFGGSTVSGTVNTTSGSKIYAGTDGGYGTNAITGSLTLVSGALAYMDVSTSASGPNDLVTVAGTLTLNNNVIHLKAPSTSSTLQTTDYTLFTSLNPVSGSFAGISWDVAPVNASNFSIQTSGNTVKLHYSSSTAPTAGGTATPATVLRSQTVLITVTATNGIGGTVNSVTVDASAIGVSSPVTLTTSGGNIWTGTVAVSSDTLAGSGKTLVATVGATSGLNTLVYIPLTVIVGNDVWNGAGANDFFSSNLNWTNQTAPGLIGDSLEFAGSTRPTPDMNTNYSVTALTFDSGAGSRTIGSSTGGTLTLTGNGVTNNSANVQTLNVPVALSTAQTISAAAGDIVIGGVVSGSSALTKVGNGSLTLSASNTYNATTTINAGTLTVSGTNTLANGFNGQMTVNNGTLLLTGTISFDNPFSMVGNAAGNSVMQIQGGTFATTGFSWRNQAWDSNLGVGGVSGAAGSLQMSSGTLSLARQLAVGAATGAYGDYSQSGGSALIGGFLAMGLGSGSGLFEQSGGTFTLGANGGGLTGGPATVGAGSGSIGVLNLSGTAAFQNNGASGAEVWLGEGGAGILNMLPGSETFSHINSSVILGKNSGSTGTLNLLGGTMTVAAVARGAGTSSFNFNGGTLQASADSYGFVGATTVYVYGGGATIDNNGFGVIIGQPLLAPAGNGVNSIASFTGGAGYIAPPIVTIVPGAGDTTGTGATAIAQINPATGVVTNVVITCPGVNYTAVPTFVVSGGGATTAATITGAAPTANVSGGLTSVGGGGLVLTNVNTYTGSTVINSGLLRLQTAGSLASTNIYVVSGAYFDVSFITYTLGGNQSLSGNGDIIGTVGAAAGSKIYAGTDGGYDTITFDNDLTLASGAACYLDLGTSAGGVNDHIVVSGALTANNNVVHLKAPSPSVGLDTSDYTLITTGSGITGSFASAPVWDVAPNNAAHYTVVTSGGTVTLHYSATASVPTVTASASPATVLRNQSTMITANVTPGSGSISTVTVDLSALGGSTVSLVRSNASSLYTNTVTVPAAASAGGVSLTVTATDNLSQSGSTTTSLTVNTSTEVWNGGGGNQNWSTNPNWVSGFAPGYAGDTIAFAGPAGPTPNMDTNYTATGLAFNSGAISFNIGAANNNTLTLTASGVANNSANAQTLNVPGRVHRLGNDQCRVRRPGLVRHRGQWRQHSLPPPARIMSPLAESCPVAVG